MSDGTSETSSSDRALPGKQSGVESAYWTPPDPDTLPPTIIRRRKPPTAGELMGRFGKPAAVALTVAAISSSNLWPAPAAAASNDDDQEPSRTTEHGPAAQTPPSYELLSDDEDPATNTVVERDAPVTYKVKPGDEVRAIARSFGLQTMTVVWNNDLPDPDLIYPDEELLILPVDGVLVEVQPGDTLNSLAEKYGTSTTAIVNYEPNAITNPDVILPGQTLIVPGGKPPEPLEIDSPVLDQIEEQPSSGQNVPPEPTVTEASADEPDAVDDVIGESIEVQPGDTLATVAQRFGVTIDELARANAIDDIDLIYSGQTLDVPGEEVIGESQESPDETSNEPQPEPDAPASEEPTGEPDPPAPDEPPADPDTPATAEPSPTEESTQTASPEPTESPEPEPRATPAPDPTPEPEQPQQSAAPSDIPGLLEYYANQYGLDPNLVKAIAWRESGWNQSATSSMGAQGVMQIMPTTGTYINNNLVSRDLNIRGNAADNIEAGAAYLAQRINQMGSVERGVAAYFMGPVWVQNNGVTGAARTYVDRIYEIRDYIATHGEPPSWR